MLHSQIYRAQHRWNPPADLPPEMAGHLFMDESELIPEYLWYSVDTLRRPTGVVSLRSTDVPEVLELGWIGVLEGIDDSVHRALFDTALAAVGDRELKVEVDENQILLLRYVNELPVHWHDVDVRYERPAFS